MSSHHSLPSIKFFTVERHQYMIDLTQRTIIKKDSKPIQLKLPILSQRQSIIGVREPTKIRIKKDQTTEIQKILDYKSPQYTLKKMLEKKVKTVTFL